MTLLEVMIGLSLFMIGIMGFFALSYQLRRVMAFGRDITQASILAGSQVEILRGGGMSLTGTNQVGIYRVRWQMTPVPSQAHKVASIVVDWEDLNGQGHLFSTDALIAD